MRDTTVSDQCNSYQSHVPTLDEVEYSIMVASKEIHCENLIDLQEQVLLDVPHSGVAEVRGALSEDGALGPGGPVS